MKNIGIGGHESEVEFFRRLYRVFDSDRNGQVDFEELYTGLSSLLAGSARVKLQMFFDMFFTEERQSAGLSKFNVYKLFMAMSQFFGSPSEQYADELSPVSRERSCEWTQVFRNIDVNHDGMVSFEELYLHVLRHPELCDFLDSAVLRFGQANEDTVCPMRTGSGESASSAGGRRRSSAGSTRSAVSTASIKSSATSGSADGGLGRAAFRRALTKSVLVNKVANRRTSYSKPWQQAEDLTQTRRCTSVEPSRTGSGQENAGPGFLPRVSSNESSTSCQSQQSNGSFDVGLSLRLERSDSNASSDEWSTEGTPPGTPTERLSEAGTVRSGATSVRERPVNDSPNTWLLKNKQARQFVAASKSSNSSAGDMRTENLYSVIR